LMRQKQIHGFQTGDMVRAIVSKGKYKGIHVGRVVVRRNGSFSINKKDINYKYCKIIQKNGGYNYSI